MGRKKDRQGDPKAAILLLNRSLALGQESAETQLVAAKVYSELEDWPQVITHAQRAVALSPDMREAWYRLARALDRVGRKSEGDAAMKRFLALNAQTHSPVSTFVLHAPLACKGAGWVRHLRRWLRGPRFPSFRRAPRRLR